MCDLEIGRKCSVQRNVNDKIKKSGRTGSIVLRIALFCCAMSSKKASQLSSNISLIVYFGAISLL